MANGDVHDGIASKKSNRYLSHIFYKYGNRESMSFEVNSNLWFFFFSFSPLIVYLVLKTSSMNIYSKLARFQENKLFIICAVM